MPDNKNPATSEHCLVDTHGHVPFGRFPHSLDRINGRDADLRTPMGKRASSLARHFHYKQFQFFGISSNELLAGCALADTAWMTIAFFYLFDPKTQKLEEFTWRAPLGFGSKLSDSPTDGKSVFRQGKTEITMDYQRTGNCLQKCLHIVTPDLQLDAQMLEPENFQPMSICTQTGINGWAYTNKVSAVPVTGKLQRHGIQQDFSQMNAWGNHDFSAGYMRRQTFWNWASLSASSGNRAVGLNLSCGVNETSFSENCLWIEGKLQPLGGTRFEYDRNDLMAAWQISTIDERVSLTFTPQGIHRERLDLKLFASNFNQIFGYFEGSLTLDDGSKLPIDRIHGFVEEQYAKW